MSKLKVGSYSLTEGSIRTFVKPQYDSIDVQRRSDSEHILMGNQFSIDFQQQPETLNYDHKTIIFIVAKVNRDSRESVVLLKLDELPLEIQEPFSPR